MKVTEAELEQFRTDLEEILTASRRVQIIVGIQVGRKYARITVRGGAGHSAYCFVVMDTGDILKAASWESPAKHARGNIRSGTKYDWWNKALTPWGARYRK